MIGICGLITDYSRISIENSLESIVLHYLETKAGYFANRAIFIFCELLKERQLFKEAAHYLIKYAGDVN